MKMKFKGFLPMLLTVALVLSLVVAVTVPARAADDTNNKGVLDLGITGLSASWEYDSSANGQTKPTWAFKDNIIEATATGYKVQFATKVFQTWLTLENTLNVPAQLSFDYILSGGNGADIGTVTCDKADSMADGKFAYELAPNETVVITLVSPKGSYKNTLIIKNISFFVDSGEAIDSTFFPAEEGGSYTVTPAGGEAQTITSQTVLSQGATAQYILEATPADGYVFLGWYSEAKGEYLSYVTPATLQFREDPQLKPVFASDSQLLFSVGVAKFTDLTAAGAYAAENGATQINMLNSGTISGEHTIPAGVTLLVPFDEAYTMYTTTPETVGLTESNATKPWEIPYAYRTLTLAADAKITVHGAISVSAKHHSGNNGQQTTGTPSGACGWIEMAAGSQIILENGSFLYAWGYIEGQGKITAKSGATVYENIQFTDFRGGNATLDMVGNEINAAYMVFPMSQYYVQNIEVLTIYEAGSNEYVYTTVYMSSKELGSAVKFVGEGGMFVATEGTVTKDYIEAEDRLKVTTNGTAQLNGLSMTVSTTTVDSSLFMLPINSNIDIIIASGTTTVNQSMAMLPGSTLTVNKGAEMVLARYDALASGFYGGGHNFIIYDADNWTWGLDANDLMEGVYTTVTGNYVHSSQRIRPLSFSAANDTKVIRTEKDLVDVVFNINGTVTTNGFLYTTSDMTLSGNGAQIISSQGTGKLIMANGAGLAQATVQANYNGSIVYLGIPMLSAQLRNGDGSLTDTTGAEAGSIFYYNATQNKWLRAVDATITFDANGGDGSMSSIGVEKDAVANSAAITLSANAFTNGDKQFLGWNTKPDGTGTSYADGAAIVVDGDITLYAQWKSNKVTYTWMNGYNNTPIKTEEVDEGSAPNHPANPTKPADAQYTYTFDKWVSSVDGEGNVTYTATYTQNLNSYEITWDIEGETTHEEFAYGTTPAYKGETPTKTSDDPHITYKFTGWSPAIVTVTGDATYTAQFQQNTTLCEDKDGNHHCDTCQAELSKCKDDNNDHKCDICEVKTSDHTGGTADCLDPATCEICGEKYGEVDPDNHIIEDPFYLNTAPGQHVEQYICCGVKGSTGTCVDGNKDHTCELCSGKVSDHIGGTATCLNLATCEICGQPYGEKNPANHASTNVTYSYNYDKTHTVMNVCCGAEASEDCSDAAGDRDHKCDLCQATVTEHTGGTATCKEFAECTECGALYGQENPNNHTEGTVYSYSGVGQHKEVYICCGAVASTGTCVDENKDHICELCSGKASEHTGGEATCQALATCEICGKSYGDLASDNHVGNVVYVNNGENHTSKYEGCGHVINEAEAHTYSDDFVCSCGEIQKFTITWMDGNIHLRTDTYQYGATITPYEVADIPGLNGTYISKFVAWQVDGVDAEVPATMPGENLVYTVRWGRLGWFVHNSFKVLDDYLIGWYCINGLEYSTTQIEGGTWYYFDAVTYRAATGVSMNTHPITGETGMLAFGETGAFLENQNGLYADPATGQIYYLENGVAVANKGLVRYITAEGEVNYYYFGCGVDSCKLEGCKEDVYTARVDCVHWIANDNGLLPQWDYTFGADGIILHDDAYAKHDNPETALHAIVEYEDGKYYTIDGVKAYVGLFQGEDGYYYYARSSGKLVTDCSYWISKTNGLVPEKSYTFDAEGRVDLGNDLVSPEDKPAEEDFTGIYEANDGKLYYYENGEKTYAGLVEIDGDLYYVTSSCEIKTGRYWITKTNGILPEGSYEFGEDGKMVRTTGIVEEGGQKWYYQDGNKYYAGLFLHTDGNYYYANSSGLIITGKTYWISKTNNLVPEKAYSFNAEGHMDMTGVKVDTTVVEKNFTGIQAAEDGTLYYYKNGAKFYAGLIEIDGDFYYVNSKCEVVCGKIYWISKTNGLMVEGSYTFGEDGKMI